MRTFVPLLEAAQLDRLPARAREVIEYRKSGLSLNHIQGCPLDCAYCIRHTYGLWDQRQPDHKRVPEPRPSAAPGSRHSMAADQRHGTARGTAHGSGMRTGTHSKYAR